MIARILGFDVACLADSTHLTRKLLGFAQFQVCDYALFFSSTARTSGNVSTVDSCRITSQITSSANSLTSDREKTSSSTLWSDSRWVASRVRIDLLVQDSVITVVGRYEKISERRERGRFYIF
jgi:hypothetical protein